MDAKQMKCIVTSVNIAIAAVVLSSYIIAVDVDSLPSFTHGRMTQQYMLARMHLWHDRLLHRPAHCTLREFNSINVLDLECCKNTDI